MGDQILATLRGGAMPTKDLVETLDMKEQTVERTLRRLRDRGKILRIGDAWGLAPP